MKTNGYAIREALKKWNTASEISYKQFKESIFQFEGDDLPNPKDASDEYIKAEDAIAKLETAQQKYNLEVEVDMGEANKVPLAYLVKTVGSAGRFEKMWREAVTGSGRDKYSFRENTRNKDDIIAKRMITIADEMKFANEAATRASKVRAAIAQANATEIDLDIDPALFE